MTRVTVCIPAFNASPFISQTLDTILNQSYQNFKILVSDNHSTDNTVDIVRHYHDKNPQISLTVCPLSRQDDSLRTTSLSAIDNGNHLLSLADTELIALYHADDLYHRDIMAAEVEFLDQHKEAVAVFTMTKLMDYCGQNVSKRSISLPPSIKGKEVFSHIELLTALVEKSMQLSTPTCMMRRDAVMQAGPIMKNHEQASDYDYWLRMAQIGAIGIIDRPLLLRRIGAHQDSFRGQTVYRHSYMPSVGLFEEHIKYLPDGHDSKTRLLNALRVLKSHNDLRIARDYIIEGRRSEAIRYITSQRLRDHSVQWLLIYAILKITGPIGLDALIGRAYWGLLDKARSLKWAMRPLKLSDFGT
jgi:glycosyltransferase involved in cell wall biosynthesis